MVTDEMIKSYTERHNLLYTETSSKANENIEKCFVNITRILLERVNPIKPPTSQITDPKITLLRENKPVKSGCAGNKKCTI